MAGGINLDATTGPEKAQRPISGKQFLQLFPALAVIGLFLIGPLTFILIYSFLTPGTYGGVE